MLVIRTSDGKIRWMNVTEYLKLHSTGGRNVKQRGFDIMIEVKALKGRNSIAVGETHGMQRHYHTSPVRAK